VILSIGELIAGPKRRRREQWREQTWIGGAITRFGWAMDDHTPLKDIDPRAV
jgi:hypothetical protein